MTWRSAICSETRLVLLLCFACAYSSAGSLSGHVDFAKAIDTPEKRKSDSSGVVVWLTSAELPGAGSTRKHTQMIQKGKKFSPHILAIQTGTSVDFPNLDAIFHNAFSNFEGQLFDIGLYPPGSSRSIRFTRPGIVKVFCNIHPSMSATIVVVDSTYFAVTDHAGNYAFPDVSPATYQVHFFHERATPDVLARLVQTVTVNSAASELASTTISEAGYLPVGHKNKYDRDYPANSDHPDTYSVPIQ